MQLTWGDRKLSQAKAYTFIDMTTFWRVNPPILNHTNIHKTLPWLRNDNEPLFLLWSDLLRFIYILHHSTPFVFTNSFQTAGLKIFKWRPPKEWLRHDATTPRNKMNERTNLLFTLDAFTERHRDKSELNDIEVQNCNGLHFWIHWPFPFLMFLSPFFFPFQYFNVFFCLYSWYPLVADFG